MTGASQSGPSNGPLTVGLDIGTTSCKALLVDEEGTVVARARLASGLRAGGGVFEHDAPRSWWELPRQALAQVSAGFSARIAGVAICAPIPSLAPVGRDGVPTGPGLLYGDERGQAPGPGGAMGTQRREGVWDSTWHPDASSAGDDPPASDDPPAGDDPTASDEMLHMAAWAARSYPDAHGYWPAQAVANASLGGEGVLDLASAFGTGALYNGSGWDGAICESLGVAASKLPRVAVFGEVIGKVQVGVAPSPAPSKGVVLAAGSVDGFCEQIVSGAVSDGDLLVTLGSTLVVWLCVPGWPEVAPGLWRVPHVAGGKALVGGPSNAGGLWVDWVERLFGGARGAARSGHEGLGCPDSVGPEGVPLWWPWARGERAPSHDPRLRIGLAGADLSHGPAALRRAGYEASAFVVRRIAELASRTGTQVKRVLVTGGGAARPEWVSAIADALAMPVLAFEVPESAALGAAFLARMGVAASEDHSGVRVEDAAAWARWRSPVDPDQTWAQAVAERYERWLAGC